MKTGHSVQFGVELNNLFNIGMPKHCAKYISSFGWQPHQESASLQNLAAWLTMVIEMKGKKKKMAPLLTLYPHPRLPN